MDERDEVRKLLGESFKRTLAEVEKAGPMLGAVVITLHETDDPERIASVSGVMGDELSVTRLLQALENDLIPETKQKLVLGILAKFAKHGARAEALKGLIEKVEDLQRILNRVPEPEPEPQEPPEAEAEPSKEPFLIFLRKEGHS